MSFPALAFAVDAAVAVGKDHQPPPGISLNSITVWVRAGDAIALADWCSISWFDPRAVSTQSAVSA